MFLLDDLLLAPLNGFVAICRKVQEMAQEERENQEKDITAALVELHQLLESGGIGDEEFNTRETALLDRLEELERVLGGESDED
jgi:hypothetical protein